MVSMRDSVFRPPVISRILAQACGTDVVSYLFQKVLKPPPESLLTRILLSAEKLKYLREALKVLVRRELGRLSSSRRTFRKIGCDGCGIGAERNGGECA